MCIYQEENIQDNMYASQSWRHFASTFLAVSVTLFICLQLMQLNILPKIHDKLKECQRISALCPHMDCSQPDLIGIVVLADSHIDKTVSKGQVTNEIAEGYSLPEQPVEMPELSDEFTHEPTSHQHLQETTKSPKILVHDETTSAHPTVATTTTLTTPTPLPSTSTTATRKPELIVVDDRIVFDRPPRCIHETSV